MKKWIVKNTFTKSKPILDQLLSIRNVANISEFLAPIDLDEAISQLGMDTKSVIDLINSAISQKMPIIIHGDYDADGILATTIMYKALKHHMNYENTYWFIPNRFAHGYGLSLASSDEMFQMVGKPFLLITVDCGITSYNEVAYLKDKGCKVIVSDHHQKPERVPEADALLWNDALVGSSIAFLIARSLGDLSVASVAYAAIATVTDLQKLKDFNRTLVKKGLEIINSDYCPVGLKALLKASGKVTENITTYEIGWLIGPRINATGRIDTASSALNLFLTDDETEAASFAQNLNDLNANRQDLTEEMFNLANLGDSSTKQKIIVSYSKEYHEGIIGLVAAKLVQKYYRPAIVISLTDETAKGSARSIPGVNIIEFLRSLDFGFSGLGGHPMAAGFSLQQDLLPAFENVVVNKSAEVITDEMLVPTLYADLEIPLDEIDLNLSRNISKLEPFGVDNDEPVFVSTNVMVGKLNFMGKELTHVSLELMSGTGELRRAVYFNGASNVEGLSLGSKVDVMYKVQSKSYKGKDYVDLIIRDIRPTGVVL